jgi:hypothetical protein
VKHSVKPTCSGGALGNPVDDADPRSARREEPAQQDGARDRPVRATGAGMRRERGPEDASREGTHQELNVFHSIPDMRGILRGDFLWVLSLFAQGKDLGGGGESPRQCTRRSRSQSLFDFDATRLRSERTDIFHTLIPTSGNCSCIALPPASLQLSPARGEGVKEGGRRPRLIKTWIPAVAGMTRRLRLSRA